MSDTEALRQQILAAIPERIHFPFHTDLHLDLEDRLYLADAVVPVVESWASTAGNEVPDEALRAAISRQWATDWDSPEDAVYDDALAVVRDLIDDLGPTEHSAWTGKAAERRSALKALVAELESCRSDLVGLRAKIEALADDMERRGGNLQLTPELKLVGNAYVGSGQRLRALMETP